jgi:hypothetical protein
MGLFGNAGPTSSQLSTSTTTNTTTTDAGQHQQDNSIQSNGPVFDNSNGSFAYNVTNNADATLGAGLQHLADSAFATISEVTKGIGSAAPNNQAPPVPLSPGIDKTTLIYIGVGLAALIAVGFILTNARKGRAA